MPNPDLRQMYAQTRARGFGPEVKRRIMLGTYVLSAGYYDAVLSQGAAGAYARSCAITSGRSRGSGAVDAIRDADQPDACASGFGERMSDPLQMYLADIFTVSANLAGLPAISDPLRALYAKACLAAARRGFVERRRGCRSGSS
jgi:aspartyl-tRNA(Asn)/glutamyl-tRNA(Gln) amidotransferase subunit A